MPKNQHPRWRVSTHRTHDAFTRVVTLGKPFTLATPYSPSRSSRKLRGTSPFIAPSPARRRRVSGAPKSVRRVFSRRVKMRRVARRSLRRTRRSMTSSDEGGGIPRASARLARVVEHRSGRQPPSVDVSSRRRTTRAAPRLIFSVEIPRERARSRDAFPPGSAPRERADSAPGHEPARHLVAAAFHARARSPVGPGSPEPSLQPSKTLRSPRRDPNCTVRKGPKYPREISRRGIDLRNDGSGCFFSFFGGVGSEHPRTTLTSEASLSSDIPRPP